MMEYGELFAVMHGRYLRPWWYAGNLDFLLQVSSFLVVTFLRKYIAWTDLENKKGLEKLTMLPH